MICPNCRQAGEEMQANGGNPTDINIGTAISLHGRCLNPATCTCQHRTSPNIINQERVNQDARDPESAE